MRQCALAFVLLSPSMACFGAEIGQLTPPPALGLGKPTPTSADSLEAKIVAALPAYVPEQTVAGTISVWGHGNRQLPWMHHLAQSWEEGFRRFHPGIRIDYQMHGTSSGIPSLFTGIGVRVCSSSGSS